MSAANIKDEIKKAALDAGFELAGIASVGDFPELARFRVKVVEPDGNSAGRLRAVADNISPEGLKGVGNQRVSLFRTNFKGELKDEIWRLRELR